MNLLLDTHALLWFVRQSRELSYTALAAMMSVDNKVYVSPVSFCEIALKMHFGRLRLEGGIATIHEIVVTRQFVELQLTIAHSVAAGGLDPRHSDPFDRLLAAQSAIENMPLVTVDTAFQLFGTKTLW